MTNERMKTLMSSVNRTRQTGITTMAITILLLVIVTVMVLFSTSVGFFEQKTATNENRARISQQAAEYALNMAGEYLKASRDNLISNTAGSGWLAATGSSRRWVSCVSVGGAGAPDSGFTAGHPCLSERLPGRRKDLYFYTRTGASDGDQTLPYAAVIPAAAKIESGMGGVAAFTASARVRALLCRLDTSDPTNVACKLNPVSGNRIAVTLISDATLDNENGSQGEVKATWATYNTTMPSASVPLVASGAVKGLGNGQIVANPDAHSNGSNVIASVWSPNNVSIDGSGGGGVGSFITCQFAEFTGQLSGGAEMSMRQVKTDCPSATGNAPPCNCPKSPDPNRTSKEDWSGHGTGGGSTLHKGNDILDVAASGESACDSTTNTFVNGCRTLPDIEFFPGPNASGSPMDKDQGSGVSSSDDSMFEYIFGVDYVVANRSTNAQTLTNCGTSGTQNCFDYAMREEFASTIVANCSSLNSASSGIIYVTGACTDLSQQIGTPDAPAIVVINQGATEISLKNGLVMYGMLFIHADANNADVKGTNPQIYGSLVVEGDIKMTGQFLIVYDNTSSGGDSNKLPKSAKFGLVPGSWLDSKTSF